MIIVEIQEVSGTGVVLNETITTVTTSLDLVTASTTSDNITVEAHNTIPQGTLTNALQVLSVALSRNLNLKTFLLVNPKSFETKSQFLIWCVSYLQTSLLVTFSVQ